MSTLISKLHVFAFTANRENADTDMGAALTILLPDRSERQLKFPSLAGDQYSKGYGDHYTFDIRAFKLTREYLAEKVPFTLRAGGTNAADAWLPSQFWVIGEDESHHFHVLVGIPNWPSTLELSSEADPNSYRAISLKGPTPIK